MTSSYCSLFSMDLLRASKNLSSSGAVFYFVFFIIFGQLPTCLSSCKSFSGSGSVASISGTIALDSLHATTSGSLNATTFCRNRSCLKNIYSLLRGPRADPNFNDFCRFSSLVKQPRILFGVVLCSWLCCRDICFYSRTKCLKNGDIFLIQIYS